MSAPEHAPDYTAEYDNSGRVPNAAELIDGYMLDAAFFRESHADHMEADLLYGPEPRNMLDIFWPLSQSKDGETGHDKTAPLAMFIHGGYWQRLDRSSFSHMAGGLLAHGVAVAIPSYTLCPENTVEGIVNEMRRACLVLYQTHQRPITVVGHSAGGHLAACMLATDWSAIHPELPEDLVQSAVGISGLYDLLPLIHTPINEALGLDEDSARDASPVLWTPDALNRFEAWVGSDESNEYHRQSRDLTEQWCMLGTPTEYVIAEGQNHFTVIDALTDPGSTMVRSIVDLVNFPAIDVPLPEGDDLAEVMSEAELEEDPEPKPEPETESASEPLESDGETAVIEASDESNLDAESVDVDADPLNGSYASNEPEDVQVLEAEDQEQSGQQPKDNAGTFEESKS
ncbi:MAG: alpha/beta hydrolase [Pseudomonadota bacterium]